MRKAYEHKYGPDVDVTELIRKGMSKELDEKIKEVRGTIRVKRIHDEQFHTGGFNPRPIKFSNHYLLGTLSEQDVYKRQSLRWRKPQTAACR